ncbi:MAG TPA: alpha-galactosidase [Pseudolysinimonas sp.]
MNPTPTVVHLHSGGTSLVVDLRDGRLPRILHWGAAIGEPAADELLALAEALRPDIGDSAITLPQPVPVVPQLAEGWLGRPGIAGSRAGSRFAPLFTDAVSSITRAGDTADDAGMRLRTVARDEVSGLELAIELEVTPSGLVRVAGELRNAGDDDYRVDTLELTLPIPERAAELLDLTGRWSRERVPQRHNLPVGTWLRESRGGKPGLDHTVVLLAGEPGFGFRRGSVWGVHLGWSGSQALAAELMPSNVRLLRGGELLLPSELVLAPGASYRTPWLWGSWGEGMDELAGRFHRMLRARPEHPRAPRPVLVNTWEAVYFDQDPAALLALAQRSAELGVERFVVDDGWFSGRRDDRSSLGDWTVDTTVWPEGLDPLAARVHELGMQFGLWFEPEMVNLDSDLARDHPEWVADAGHGPGIPSRHQHVLDLTHPEAYDLVLDRMRELIAGLGIEFIKWDHNRFLTDVGSTPTGAPAVRGQVLAAYRMMDALRAEFPGLEIESCASGGGRIDLGMLERTDRVWPSDCNDPLERVGVQRWTELLLPPELLGTHIGAERSHTTGRTAPLSFRAAVAFEGNLGVELDLTRLDAETLAEVAGWIELHQRFRPLLHSGDVVHADTDPSVQLDGVVAADGSEALFRFTQLVRPPTWPPARLRLPGLDPTRRYRLERLAVPSAAESGGPAWLSTGVELSGRILSEVGVEAPTLPPERAVLLHVVAVAL